MSNFETLEKALEIVEAMKRNISDMMEIDVKTRLIMANMSLNERSEDHESRTTEND